MNHRAKTQSPPTAVDAASQADPVARLRESEQRYRALADSSPNWEFLTAPDGSFVYISPACEQISGYTPDDFLANPALMTDIIHTEDAELWRMHVTDITGDESEPVVFRIRTRGGEERWIEHVCKPIYDDNGRFLGRRGSNQDVTDRRRAEQERDFFVNRDPLTGLPNRTLFRELLQRAIQQADRDQHGFNLLLLDLDNFKTINESLGHSAGDQVLVEVAERLRALLPQVDTIARIAGDEFYIILPTDSGRSGIDLLAQRIMQDVTRPIAIQDKQIVVGASLGIAVYPADGADAERLQSNADAALHQAKLQGRGLMRFFSPDLAQRAQDRLTLNSDLHQALENRQLRLHYQPQIDLRCGGLVGFEALARWQHPERGWIAPAEFIPLAEESDLITRLGDWALREACRQVVRWADAGLPYGPVSVNLSATQLNRGDLVASVMAALNDTGVPPQLVNLEITESTVMVDSDHAMKVISALKALGIGLAIDNFGTGYSSLAYLQQLDIGKVKVDLSFIREMTRNSNSAAIVRAIIALGHSLGLEVIAEGVETEDQARRLRELRCDAIQGYLISHPLPADEMTRFLTAFTPVELAFEEV
ncbi:EAL domain-containing protein [Thiohalocapsa marina]|uniref:cyclic-guanylate-specific phosphodiesterase n=1 Tax=Thiohalocapsa marina TaxID=424902 RepID=A0A5M8FK91_9GAMM|nr:GGDEF domain-containing phosphodiesterase [Thiohalocapsa marina]KAA6184410.1 EAL domain-containing protein [Thiohalocapsa marina]